ncbi:hypothetical protein [Pelotalea chapellei]|uniref:Uncharacterized protein n=1 Tax=Pelotalea chapellei TaxID=44671 RepID=A0ABS5U4U4_9BACT|nr:hypothetical protein [Pelotalea chapellei]MBT1070672.1 hypothetical protein [Pelotalea chapellei]
MCGYCVERSALDILNKDIRGNLSKDDLGYSLGRYFYLRETPNFISALDRLRRSLAQKKQILFPEVPPIVVLYRGLEVLLQQGFESPLYQQLLKRPLYRDAIVAACSDQQRKAFDLATNGLAIKHLGLLYDAETYFWGERSTQLRVLAQVLPSCRNLIKHYISWWLEGKLQNKNDLSKGSDAEAYHRFDLLSRALYFSVLMVGSCLGGKKMLLAIAQTSPAETPAIEGKDLWLQRVAALKLYDLEGFNSYCKHVTNLRATHYYYINQMRSFSMEQKQFLQDEVRRLPDADSTDDFIRMSSWLREELDGEEK